MTTEMTILIAEDDDGHAALIQKNLKRAGVTNTIIRFRDGQEVLDFLHMQGDGSKREPEAPYVLLLDIRMPKIDGFEVLSRIKDDPQLRKIPVIMVTTTDDQQDIDRCHELGCSSYITKPVEYENFVHAITQLGLFLTIVDVPCIKCQAE